jgi:uncharacterized protein (TIGR02611 family)
METHVLSSSSLRSKSIASASNFLGYGAGVRLRRRKSAEMIKTLQQAKRLLKIIFGFTLLAFGLIMIVTPGPGWLTIMIGLGVLAAEYVWARRLLDTLKEQGLRLRDTILSRPKTGPA